ncbi:EpsG family protein [Vibrio splendidus]|uniref:EpsG family protein n=1 Tax=Vibrio splendidus TaxID=29497 RepID=UPI003D11D2CE
MLYSIFFLFVISIPVLIYANEQEQKKINFIFLLLAVFICGGRYEVDPDYLAYYDIYQLVPRIQDYDFSLVLYDSIYGEKGFLFLLTMIKTFGGTFYTAIFIIALLTYAIAMYSCNKVRDYPSFSFLIYIFSTTAIFNFIQIRFGLALSLLMLSYIFIRDGKKVSCTIAMIAAISMHTYVLTAIPVYIFYKIKKDLNVVVLLFASLVIFLLFTSLNELLLNKLNTLSLSRANNYLNQDKYQLVLSFFSPVFLKSLLVTVLITFVLKLYKEDDVEYKYYMIIYFFCSLMAFSPIFYGRYAAMVDVFFAMGVSVWVRYVNGYYWKRLVLIGFIFVYSLFYLVDSMKLIDQFGSYRTVFGFLF